MKTMLRSKECHQIRPQKIAQKIPGTFEILRDRGLIAKKGATAPGMSRLWGGCQNFNSELHGRPSSAFVDLTDQLIECFLKAHAIDGGNDTALVRGVFAMTYPHIGAQFVNLEEIVDALVEKIETVNFE
jgi:hypothetical protein